MNMHIFMNTFGNRSIAMQGLCRPTCHTCRNCSIYPLKSTRKIWYNIMTSNGPGMAAADLGLYR